MAGGNAKKVRIVALHPRAQDDHQGQVCHALLHLLVCLSGTGVRCVWLCDITLADTDIVVKDTHFGGVAVTSRESDSRGWWELQMYSIAGLEKLLVPSVD